MFPSNIAGLGQGVLGKVTFWLTLAPYSVVRRAFLQSPLSWLTQGQPRRPCKIPFFCWAICDRDPEHFFFLACKHLPSGSSCFVEVQSTCRFVARSNPSQVVIGEKP